MRRIRNMVRGFTLIELLIVLAVIAALLSIVTPIALDAVAQAKAAQVAANFRNIRTAVESYIYTTGETPNDLNDLVSKGYLSSAPQKFSISITEAATTITITINSTETADATRVRQFLPEVIGTSGDMTLYATVVKWK